MKALHRYQTFVSFSDTDASGRIYFSQIYMIAHKAMEDFAIQKGAYKDWFTNTEWATPVRHSEAEYKKELRSGDPISIDLFIDKIGNSSFTIRFEVLLQDQSAATVRVTHVTVDLKTKSKREVPEDLKKLLS